MQSKDEVHNKSGMQSGMKSEMESEAIKYRCIWRAGRAEMDEKR